MHADPPGAQPLRPVPSRRRREDRRPQHSHGQRPPRRRRRRHTSSEKRVHVAVASVEGIFVNCHLGHARELLVYAEREDEFELVDVRKTPPEGGAEERWEELADLLFDCRAVVASAPAPLPSGPSPDRGISLLCTEGLVEDALEIIFGGRKAQLRPPSCSSGTGLWLAEGREAVVRLRRGSVDGLRWRPRPLRVAAHANDPLRRHDAPRWSSRGRAVSCPRGGRRPRVRPRGSRGRRDRRRCGGALRGPRASARHARRAAQRQALGLVSTPRGRSVVGPRLRRRRRPPQRPRERPTPLRPSASIVRGALRRSRPSCPRRAVRL